MAGGSYFAKIEWPKISLSKISYEKRDFTFFSTKFHEKYDNYIYADQKMMKTECFTCKKCRNTTKFADFQKICMWNENEIKFNENKVKKYMQISKSKGGWGGIEKPKYFPFSKGVWFIHWYGL